MYSFPDLKKLEYRGYDSSGIAILTPEKILRHRAVGKIIQMESSLPENFNIFTKNSSEVKIGIAHTRWATHGKPSEENAHPHIDCSQKFVLVHNGIIENYQQLKSKLKKHKFKSETDTETIVHLIEENYKKNNDILLSLKTTLKELKGSFAIVLISLYEQNKIYFARKDSPLVIGVGETENFLASDIPALLDYTKKFIFLENGDFGFISTTEIKILNLQTKGTVQRKINKINWNSVMIEKVGYRHFMLKEIYEQPQVIKDNINSRIISNKIVFKKRIVKFG